MKPRIHVVTLAVADLDRALTFYRDGMGSGRRANQDGVPRGRGHARRDHDGVPVRRQSLAGRTSCRIG
jgi:catechol 2,3-dioxygenase-like lactoylglutathione lyase family enzyme